MFDAAKKAIGLVLEDMTRSNSRWKKEGDVNRESEAEEGNTTKTRLDSWRKQSWVYILMNVQVI